MATQRQFSTMFGLVVVVVSGLLSMTAVSASTTHSIKWNLEVGPLQQHTSNVVEVGDILHFQYDKKVQHLLKVTYEAFRGCDNSAPLQKWIDGDTKIGLSKPGTLYYINGHNGHCLEKEVFIVVDIEVDTESGQADRLASTATTGQTARRLLVSNGQAAAQTEDKPADENAKAQAQAFVGATRKFSLAGPAYSDRIGTSMK